MHVTDSIEHLAFDILDEEGRVYVSVHGQPGTNSWTIRCPQVLTCEVVSRTPMIIAHGNTEAQIRRFTTALADAFNRHAESQ